LPDLRRRHAIRGIEVWIGPNAKGGDQPFIFRFNANEKRGTILVEQRDKKANSHGGANGCWLTLYAVSQFETLLSSPH
jgi:hypothetical protein